MQYRGLTCPGCGGKKSWAARLCSKCNSARLLCHCGECWRCKRRRREAQQMRDDAIRAVYWLELQWAYRMVYPRFRSAMKWRPRRFSRV